MCTHGNRRTFGSQFSPTMWFWVRTLIISLGAKHPLLAEPLHWTWAWPYLIIQLWELRHQICWDCRSAQGIACTWSSAMSQHMYGSGDP